MHPLWTPPILFEGDNTVRAASSTRSLVGMLLSDTCLMSHTLLTHFSVRLPTQKILYLEFLPGISFAKAPDLLHTAKINIPSCDSFNYLTWSASHGNNIPWGNFKCIIWAFAWCQSDWFIPSPTINNNFNTVSSPVLPAKFPKNFHSV